MDIQPEIIVFPSLLFSSITSLIEASIITLSDKQEKKHRGNENHAKGTFSSVFSGLCVTKNSLYLLLRVEI